MTDHFHRIYAGQAAAYQRMIAAEDADGRLAAFLRAELGRRDRPRILDLGSGTGRFPLMLGDLGDRFLAVDRYAAMLREQARQRGEAGASWWLCQADMRALPVPAGSADVILAGWSLGHFVGWYGCGWPIEAALVLAEIDRVAAPGALVCICETLSTGRLDPAPPTPGLAAYYRWLETDHGFTRHVLPTDYSFASVEEAVVATEFFFGEELGRVIRRKGWSRVPEWTGVWLRTQPEVASPPKNHGPQNLLDLPA